MNIETRFLAYDQCDCEYVILDVVSAEGFQVVLDTSTGNHELEFNLWDLLKALYRRKRNERTANRDAKRDKRRERSKQK